jgi:cytochrome b
MSEKRLVWDLPTRLFHWLLVLCVAGSYATAKAGFNWTKVHFWLGYVTLGLVAFRIIWGFVGPRHARFTSFVGGPSRLLAYVRTLLRRDSPSSPGHNPLGGMVVVVMLLMLGAQAITGLFLIDNTEVWTAPYYPAVSAGLAGTLGRIHHLNFDVLMWVIVLHVLAIIFYRVFKRQNLVMPMITGHKSAKLVASQDAIGSSQLVKALVIAALCAGAVYWLIAAAPPPPEIYY